MATPEPYPYRKLNYPIVNLGQSFTDAEKIQGRANLGIPTSVNQANKVLTVEDATGALGWEDAGSGLPASTSADEGKVLTVDSNGDPQWEEPSGGTVTDVQVDGVSVVTAGVAEITMPVVPTKTSELQNDSGFITSADLPTVNDGTLTIQKNGATVDTFTANSSTNKTVNIAVPTNTSDLTNDSGFVTGGDLPTVNDGTLTIQKNGTTIDTFTANSSTNKTVNISVPTKTSDLTNDSGFVTSADLPTVNDGTLTIQKNGTTIDTFSANSSSNKTVDISVPTKTSDLTNDSGFITSSDIPAAPVSDVQVDGVSVVTAGVANITLPTVNNGTLTIQKNGTTVDTFTANSSANKTVDISVPTKTSDLTNDSGFITSSALPTVNDGTLTIQKNGTTVETFSANSSSNKTVDISVPTKTSDLTNDSGFITSAALPTVNDATLTIQKNGSTVDTFTANASSNKTVNITVPTNTSDLNNDSGFITSGDIPAQVNSDWNANSGVAEILNKPTTVPIVAGANISISDTQNGVVVAADLSSKEDEFDAGDGLEFTTDGQGNRVLQVEAPVDIVAGPGIVIDNPDGNTLRISVAHLDDWEDVSSEITKSTTIITGGSITFRYNKAMKMISLIGEIHVQGGGDVYILPEKYRPQTNFTLSNPGATSYIDYTPSTGKFVARSGANGYFSWTMTMPCLGE